MNLEDLFAVLHEKLGQELLERIESGEATSQELNVARQFLNDNGISGIPKRDNALGKLADTLPSFDENHPH